MDDKHRIVLHLVLDHILDTIVKPIPLDKKEIDDVHILLEIFERFIVTCNNFLILERNKLFSFENLN